MNLEFNEDGSVKVPEIDIEVDEKFKEKLEKAKNNPEKVIVEYEEIAKGYEDEWRIILPDFVRPSILFRLKKWVDNRVEIKIGSAWLEEKDEREYILSVRGRQGRCEWAHSFLNGLNTALIKMVQTNIKQKNTCKHNFHVRYSEAFKGELAK